MITFTVGGEKHVLPIDSSKTLRVGSVSPSVAMEVEEMTDATEKKALALVNEVRRERGHNPFKDYIRRNEHDFYEGLCRAIEQHEAFRQEVSDAVEGFYRDNPYEISCYCDDLKRFIIAKPDPLVEVLRDMGYSKNADVADDFRAALAARGLEIREKQP